MNYDDELSAGEAGRPTSLTVRDITVRDIVQVGFRHEKILLAVFGILSLLALLYAFALPPKYEAETKILVRQGRVDPVVSPIANVPLIMREPVTEEELNSEVEILLSDDVLRQVVTACGLDTIKPVTPLLRLFRSRDNPRMRMWAALINLKSALKAVPVKKTSIIDISYRGRDAELAARVLRALNAAYIEKHLVLHRPSGQFKFFEQQAENYRDHLKVAEQQLRDFSSGRNSVRPEMVRDQMLQQLANLSDGIAATRAEIAQTENRLRTLEDEAHAVPARMTTSVKSLDNGELLQQLKGTLLTLELKHTDLLSKYQKDYRPVQELEREIQKTRAAIAAEEAAPLREHTTDVDPTHTLVASELAKAKADLSGLVARQAAMETTERRYQAAVHDLANKGILEQDLLREVKAAEENYRLYLQKREESRITDELDQMRILDVAVAEEPMVPALPLYSSRMVAIAGLLFAAIVSVGVVLVLAYFDSSFHAPHEIEGALNIPVLAAVPRFGTGNGRHKENDHRMGAGNALISKHADKSPYVRDET